MARCIPQFVSSLLSRPRRRQDEAGQVLMMFVLLIPVLLGMAALAIDLGSFSAERRSLQNAADAIALAAAQELPDQAAAQTAAADWAETYYDIPAGELTVVTMPVSATNPNPSVKVTIDRMHEFAFMKALSINDAPIAATATAIKTSPGGLANVVPWAVLESTKDESEPGETVVLKYDANDASSGNFGAIRLDGSGSSVYLDSIEGGSSSIICSTVAPDCGETSPVCEDAVCETQTGNMVGSTRDGVDYRIENTSEFCDDFDEVFEEQSDGSHELNSACNPWLDGSHESLRVIILPVIESLCNGSCSVTVTGFSLFWLDGYGGEKCSGSLCDIEGRFIDADTSVNALIGAYDEDATLQFARLVE